MTAVKTITQQTLIPDLPRGVAFVDERGHLTDDWRSFLDNLILSLQTIISPEGNEMPSQTASNIALLTAVQSIANIIYDSTNNVFNGNINNTTASSQFWLPFAMITQYAGNPNGHVAGFVTELCLDTTHSVMYVCTAAGNAAGATWTSI